MKKGNFIILGSSMQANAYFALLNSESVASPKHSSSHCKSPSLCSKCDKLSNVCPFRTASGFHFVGSGSQWNALHTGCLQTTCRSLSSRPREDIVHSDKEQSPRLSRKDSEGSLPSSGALACYFTSVPLSSVQPPSWCFSKYDKFTTETVFTA